MNVIEQKRADVKAYDEFVEQAKDYEKQIQYINNRIEERDDDKSIVYLDQGMLIDGLQNGLIPYLQKLKDAANAQIKAMEEPEIEEPVAKTWVIEAEEPVDLMTDTRYKMPSGWVYAIEGGFTIKGVRRYRLAEETGQQSAMYLTEAEIEYRKKECGWTKVEKK